MAVAADFGEMSMKAGRMARRCAWATAALLSAAVLISRDVAAFTVRVEGDPVAGSGRALEENRQLTGFKMLRVDGEVDVALTAADAETVSVRADDNIVPLIETRVEDGVLRVGVRGGAALNSRNRVVVKVSFRDLASISVYGAGDVAVDRVRGPIFETSLYGSGNVTVDRIDGADAVALLLTGSGNFQAGGGARSLGALVRGSGDVRAGQLQVREAAVRIMGSGDVTVHAVDRLEVEIHGSGDVRYRGQPQLIRRIRGSGSVVQLR
jgi:hypothetical protein